MITLLAQAETPADGAASWFGLLFWPLALGLTFYFLMIRPQRNRMRRHDEMLRSIQVDDEVTTIGGIYGVVEYLDEKHAILRVEGGGKLRVMRRALSGKVTD